MSDEETVPDTRFTGWSEIAVTCGSCAQAEALWHFRCAGCSGVDLVCQTCRDYFDNREQPQDVSSCVSCGYTIATPTSWARI